MLRFDANVTQLYTELPLLDRLGAAAADGFKGVEMRSPYEETKEAMGERLTAHGLELVLFNFPAGDWGKGERGIACLPGREDEFREGLATAVEYATALGCTRLNCLAGLTPAGVSHETLEATLAGNLRHAAQVLADHGIRLQLEAINQRDNPGGFVSTTADYERIAERVGHDNLYLQYDFYHMQVMQGDLVRGFARLQKVISHVQVADNPGRHEPGTGEINYPFIFAELERLGYDGWIGCEYIPAGKTSDGLAWMRQALSR
ncbi:MAG: Hydroxypyruvate isomerase [Devosia sp.]|uniref:2-oxo-tetronate isomerase n=1 Tax=Devosia sp. TaxID=1871048 RepID=UPI00261D9C68|nr:2-oxo-tetronate isomerase [Devosia sp.]MDB5538590.1 Hydroxypyruvate isomerase [Devosia sp.]